MFAMVTSRRGKAGEGFDPDAKQGKVEIVCEMSGGGKGLPEACLSLGRFLFFLFFFVIMRYLF